MTSAEQALAAAYAAFSRGDLDAARRFLVGRRDKSALHLAGLVEKRAGNLEAARRLLDEAARAGPQDAEIAHSCGQVARLQGRSEDAEVEFHRALSLRPGFPQARLSLGRLLIDAERYREALPLYETFVSEAPASVPGRYGLATVKLALGDAEAAERLFDELLAGNERPEIRFMRARARLELARTEEALADLRVAYDVAPSSNTLATLAGAVWMRGDQDEFDRLIGEALGSPALALTAADILRQCALPERAVAALQQLTPDVSAAPTVATIEALACIDLGEARAAEEAAGRALAAEPGNHAARAALISGLLMQGRPAEALRHISRMRHEEPLRQHWIAYEVTALRLQGSPRHNQLAHPDRFVRSYALPLPSGYDTIAQFNEALRAALGRWHVYRTHPLDQSLRHGSQTPRDLTTIDDPVISAYVRALDGPIRQYLEDVGRGGDHPLTRRNRGDYEIAGCWSVRLTGGGRHVNHVHPAGWISSSYYVTVPEGTADDPDRRGWIKFGEPPFTTDPPLEPLKWLCPVPGTVVLFPSFYWHGTEPVADGAVRITAPFDVIPSGDRQDR